MSQRSQHAPQPSRQQVGKGSLLVGFLVLSLLVQSLGLTAFIAAPIANAAGTNSATTSQPASDNDSSQPATSGSSSNKNPLWAWPTPNGSSAAVTSTNSSKPQPKKPSKPTTTTTKHKPAPTATGSSKPNNVPLNTNRQVYLPKSGGKGAQPKNTYPTRPVNTYYVTVIADDAGTATDCTNSKNTDCSFRSALNAATTDGHAGSPNNQLDYIFLNAPYGYPGGSASYNPANAYKPSYNPGSGVVPFPQVPDYVAIFGDAQPCSVDNFTSNQNNFSLFYQSAGGNPALTLGSYDYLEGVIFNQSGDIGLKMAGTGSTYTCGVVDGSAGDGVQVTGSNNQVGYDDQYGGNFVAVIKGSTDGIVITGTNATYNTLSQVYVGYIPTNDFFNSGASGNFGNGVVLGGGSSYNCIGQSGTGLTNVCPIITTSGISNIIADNSDETDYAGILIDDSSNNLLVNNYIGTDETGDSGVDSSKNPPVTIANDWGIIVRNNSTYNQIGGDRSLAATPNYIGNNNQANVLLESDHNILQGNYIGIQKNQQARFDNGKDGVDLFSNYNTIGGIENANENSHLGNVISGNSYDNSNNDGYGGIVIGGNAADFVQPALSGNHNTIEGNYIGTDDTGTNAIPNVNAGIVVYEGSYNTIGATPITETANIIAGNDGDGIALYDVGGGFDTNNTISSNFIGTNSSGATLGNAFHGINAQGGITSTITSNFINNNQNSGVLIQPQYVTNTAFSITNNYIGVSPALSAAPNGSGCKAVNEDCAGVLVKNGAINNNIISNTVAAQTSFYSGAIIVDASNSNTIQSNTINQANFGIWVLDGSSNVQVGGSVNGNGQTTTSLGNVINNAAYAIAVGDPGFSTAGTTSVSGVMVQGNQIGLNGPIAGYGIYFLGANNLVSGNTIGGTSVDLGNTIANAQDGIFLLGSNTELSGNFVQYNQIGTRGGNSAAGIDLEGVQSSTVTSNTVQSSNVGVTIVGSSAPGPSPSIQKPANVTPKVVASGTASNYNTVSNNIISNNANGGVNVGTDSTDNSANNTISQNRMSQNGVIGINLHYVSGTGVSGGTNSGPNNQVQEPTINGAIIDNGTNPATLTITGTANPNSNVELFLQDPSSTVPQGKYYLTTLVADGSGNFSYSGSTTINGNAISTSNNNQLVADSTIGSAVKSAATGSTSQFSNIVNVAALPILTDNTSKVPFAATPGNLPNPNTNSINLYAQYADASYSYSVSYSGGQSNWLSVAPPSSGGIVSINNNNFNIPITVTAGLPQGIYTATVTFADTSNANDTTANKVTNVVYTVTPTPVLTASPSQVNFVATQGSSVVTPTNQTVSLSSNYSTINYTVNTTYSAGPSNWVGGIPANGSSGSVTAGTPITLTATANANGFSAGVYTATVNFVDNNNPSDVATVVVVLTVNPSTTPPAPLGILSVAPSSLNYSATQGGSNPAAQSITLTATCGSVNFTSTVTYAAGNGSWLTITPTTGTVLTTTATTVSANVTLGSLAAGTYTATVSFYNTSNNADPVKTVTVVLMVTAAANGNHTYYLPFLANQAANFTTYLVFQDIGSTTANVSIQYYDANGNPITAPSGTCTTVPQYGECLPPNPYAAGGKGTAVLTSDQPLTVLVSEATPYGGSSYPVNEGTSNSLVAPLAINNFYGGFVTQLTVGNFGTTSSSVTVTFYGSDGTLQSGATQNLTIPAHTSATIDQSAGSSGLPKGFAGWAQITGPNGSQLVAQVLEQNPNNHFVALANGQFKPQANVYAPAVFNNAFGGFYSGANIINPNNNSVTVNITYYDSNGNSYPATAFTLAAHGVAGIYQGDTNTTHPGLPASGLPSNFYGGAIVTASGGGVVMVVNEAAGLTSGGSSRSGTYGAVLNGANVVGLPAVANNGSGFTSGVTVFNTSNQAVTGQIQYYDLSGKPVGAPESFTVAGQNSTLSPHALFIAYQGAASLPDGYYGTAVVTKTSGPDSALILTTNMQSANFFYTYSEPSN